MVGEFKRLKKITDQEMKCLQLCRVWHMFITQAAVTFQIKRYKRAVESGFFVWRGGVFPMMEHAQLHSFVFLC